MGVFLVVSIVLVGWRGNECNKFGLCSDRIKMTRMIGQKVMRCNGSCMMMTHGFIY